MGESKEYMTLLEENGSINISEEVIAAMPKLSLKLPALK